MILSVNHLLLDTHYINLIINALQNIFLIPEIRAVLRIIYGFS